MRRWGTGRRGRVSCGCCGTSSVPLRLTHRLLLLAQRLLLLAHRLLLLAQRLLLLQRLIGRLVGYCRQGRCAVRLPNLLRVLRRCVPVCMLVCMLRGPCGNLWHRAPLLRRV